MRVSRLRLHNFRGWAELDLHPRGHVLLAGVPRAGRSDITLALSRLLDPGYMRVQPLLADIRQLQEPASSVAAEVTTDSVELAKPNEAEPAAATPTHQAAEYGEVEVTLIELDQELEQLCDGCLEAIDKEGLVDNTGNAAVDAALGVRLSYRVTYDSSADALDHVVYFPFRSNPETGQFARVPTAVRRSLPVVVMDAQRPLQLRAEGVLRRLVTDRDSDAALGAFRSLELAVAAATDHLSDDPAIASTVDAVLQVGGLATHIAGSAPSPSAVRFRPEDGSLAGLLRAVQPALDLDEAGLLALSSHGSTTTAILAAAEALLLASSVEGALVLGDDFGDGLDAATAEHLATLLRARSSQVWLTTRRPEVARAFAPGELVRLSRRDGVRSHHSLPEPTDKKEIALRRLLHAQLLPALTAPVVAISEGPQDLTTYTAADRYRGSIASSLSAAGLRLISADNGSGGGTTRMPRVAQLARTLGYRVVALIDGDLSADHLVEIEAACDVVVLLPAAMALEQALIAGIDVASLRRAAAILPAYGVPDPTVGLSDADVPSILVPVLHKGLHEQFLDAVIDDLGALPPVLDAALAALVRTASSRYSGPRRIDLVMPPTSAEPPGP